MEKTCPQGPKVITILGLVIPTDWDDEGGVTRVSIATFDEDEYLVQDDDVNNRLLELLGQEVAISGVVHKTDRKKSITQCSISKTEAKPTGPLMG